MKQKFAEGTDSPLRQSKFINVATNAIDSGQSLPQMLISACQKNADRPAFTNLGKTLNYGEIDRLSAQLASYLIHDVGLQRGDRVAIMMPNVLQFPIALLGVQRANLVSVLINSL